MFIQLHFLPILINVELTVYVLPILLFVYSVSQCILNLVFGFGCSEQGKEWKRGPGHFCGFCCLLLLVVDNTNDIPLGMGRGCDIYCGWLDKMRFAQRIIGIGNFTITLMWIFLIYAVYGECYKYERTSIIFAEVGKGVGDIYIYAF